MRMCKKCGTPMSQKPSGGWYCPKNQALSSARHRQENPTYMQRYRQENKEDISSYNKEYKHNNREEIAVQRKQYRAESMHPDYEIWINMKQRCSNHNRSDYYLYGGRGVSVCQRWEESFDNFISDMGPRPEPSNLFSIDRWPDKDGNYEPSNCRWATAAEQSQNTRRNVATPEIVRSIRSDSRSDGELAEEYRMSQTNVRDIKSGKIWRNV